MSSIRFSVGYMMLLALFLVAIQARQAHASASESGIHTDADVVDRVSFNPTVGRGIPTNLEFESPQGRVRLGKLLAQQRATLITFAWFDCENLCGLIMNGLADGATRLAADENYQVVVVSMDSHIKPEDMARHRQDLNIRYPKAEITKHWHFLSGTEKDTASLADALGFHFTYDTRKQQFAHPVGVIALNRQGQIRDFATGINYRTTDLAKLIGSAGTGPIAAASSPNPVLLLCYDYDPSSGRYSLAVMKILRVAAFIFLVLLGGAIWFWQKRNGMARDE